MRVFWTLTGAILASLLLPPFVQASVPAEFRFFEDAEGASKVVDPGAAAPSNLTIFTDPVGNIQWDAAYLGPKNDYADLILGLIQFDSTTDTLAFHIETADMTKLNPRPANEHVYCQMTAAGLAPDAARSSGLLELHWGWKSTPGAESERATWRASGTFSTASAPLTHGFSIKMEKPGSMTWSFDRQFLLNHVATFTRFETACNEVQYFVENQPVVLGGQNRVYSNLTLHLEDFVVSNGGPADNESLPHNPSYQPVPTTTAEHRAPGFAGELAAGGLAAAAICASVFNIRRRPGH